VVWIDCNFYSSTRTVLDFVKPYLQYGTLMFFEDWFSFRADPIPANSARFASGWIEIRTSLP
jgi:hypothetical protein